MSLEKKVQEALALGVPMRDINRVLQGNAMKSKDPMVRQQLMNAGGAVYKQLGGPIGGNPRGNALAARNAQVKGAMIGGGLRTVGGVQQNLAGGIGQAGLNNQAFTPTSALAGVADAAEARGQTDAAYQDKLSGITTAEQGRADRLAKEEADRQSSKDEKEAAGLKDKEDLKKAQETQIRYAKNAILELNKGAGKVLNFAISPTVTKSIRATGIAVARASRSQNFNDREYLEETRPEVANFWFQNNDQTSLSAFTRFKTDVYNLYVEGRKRLAGQGQITEKESALIYETVASLSNNSDSIASTLQYLIDKISFELGRPTEKVPYTSVPPFLQEVPVSELGLGIPSYGDDDEGGEDNGQSIEGAATDSGEEATGSEGNIDSSYNEFFKGTSIELPGTNGKWFEIPSDNVPQDVRELGGKNKNKVINGAGYSFVLYDASAFDVTGSQWYIRKGGA